MLRTLVMLLIQMALALTGVAGPPVWLCDDGGTRRKEAFTTDRGEFAFPGLPAGGHLLSLIHLRQKNYQATVADLDA